jgi:hypothetical protein
MTKSKRVSKKKLKRITRGIKYREERWRKLYPEVRGKVVDWVHMWSEEGILWFSVQFQDGTNFAASHTAEFRQFTCEYSDRKSGDVIVLKEYR